MDFHSLIPWKSKQGTPEPESSLPAAPLNRMRYEMDRLFDRFFSDPWGTSELPAVWSGGFAPSMDNAETDTEVAVRAELPGVDPKDVDITVTGDQLTIAGKKQSQHEEKKGNCFYSECQYGSFRRSFRLPASVDRDHIAADYANGVLTVRLQKTADAVAKRIPINAAR